ncbi:MAG: hypothetical protein H7Z72_09795 [Bacteroidetes bacterium]|nr:hypothetical protein [Fibrella sp.]
MDVPRFRFDYSFLDLPALAEQGVTTDEIEDIFYKVETFYADWHATDQIGYMVGYSLRDKFLSFTFEFRDGQQTIRLTDVFLSNEFEISTRYFRP